MAPRGIADPDKDGVPKEVWKAFQAHRDNSRRRGIAFEFDVFAWWAWWQIDDRWSNRGVGKGKFVMARKGDVGPYSPDNVVCITHGENIEQICPERRRRSMREAWSSGRHKPNRLFEKGERHPCSKPVLTPQGRFGNATEAAAAYGIVPRTAQIWAAKHRNGFSYEE